MKALKAFVVWLLLSVIPLQGMAVNVAMAGSAMRHTAAQASLHAHDTMHESHHRDHLKQQNDSCNSSHSQTAGGNCATFCPLSMWMPVAGMILPVVENAFLRISYIAFHVPFVVPDRPEHPPRFLSL